MRRRSIVLATIASGLMLMVAPAFGQWYAADSSSAGYNGSTLLQTPSGGMDPSQPPVYYPYWSNYLDRMQQEGGYYSVTGNYPGSAPVTSYYPSSQYSEATSPQAGSGQSNLYYNPSEYYSTQGAPAYQAPQVQTYQAPGSTGQAVSGVQQSTPTTGKKRRLSVKRHKARTREQATYQQPQQAGSQAYAQQQAYQQQLQAYQQQLQAYQQQQAYAQQQPYQQQQAGYPQQQAYQQQPGAYPAGQEAYYQQQGYGQTPQQGVQPQAVQPQVADSQGALSSDPTVRAAQQKAYERAVARQRAAELAAQQQAATQELTQAQQQYALAQQRVREQEAKQKALQAEYHKKAVSDAYASLRAAQQRYYELMGVSGDSGRPTQSSYQARAVPQAGQQQLQYPQMAPRQQVQAQPQAPQQYGQPAPAYQGGHAQYAGATPGAMPQPQGVTPLQAPPGQATPLRVQGQQQQQAESGSGFWATLKEIFSAPTTVGPAQSQRGMFEGRGSKSHYSD